MKNKEMKKDSEIPEQVGSERKREKLRVQEHDSRTDNVLQRDAICSKLFRHVV